MTIPPLNLPLSKGEKIEQNNANNLSAELAERFIVYLKKIFSQEKKNFIRENNADSSGNSEVKTIDNNLIQALNKDGGIKERHQDFDLEEELTNKWQTHAKALHKNLPPNYERKSNRFRLGGKKTKLLPRPSFNMFLPSGNGYIDRKSGYITIKTPLSAKIATLIVIAFITAMFIGVAQPQLAAKTANKSDFIFNYPINKFFALGGIDEYKINTDFFKNLNKILAENKKIKSNFILKNKDKLETAENSRKNFLITEEELLGLQAKASINGENNEEKQINDNWQGKADMIIWKISQAVENAIDLITKKMGGEIRIDYKTINNN